MRIASSDILYSSQHTLVEEHTRREELVAGVSTNGVWDPDSLQDGTVRAREQATSQSQPSRGEPTLLDEYLDGRSLESLRARIGGGPIDGGATEGAAADLNLLARLTEEAEKITNLEHLALQVVSGGGHAGALFSDPIESVIPVDAEITPEDELKMQLIRAAVEAFSGRELHVFTPADLNLDRTPERVPAPPVADAPHQAPEDGGADPQLEPTFGLQYRLQETHYERETTTFHAEGVVRTADGEEVSIDVSLTMGRQFASEESLEVRVGGALQDPLVVNFEGTAAELTERTYHFDLDTDGEAEQLHFVGPNSGFLALDHDDSGTIDDGSELFGARTGNGFTELAAYDEDGNQFIDEADNVYGKLRIWQKDGAGNDRLLALGESGVGAIYLGHHDTPFQVKDEANQLLGVVRSSGIYLREDGGTGTVQQLDLVV